MAKKNDVDRVTDETVAKGGVLVKFYFDMQDKDPEKLKGIMVDLINERLMKEKGVVYCYGAIDEPLEKNGMYITSAIVTTLFDSFIPLMGIAFNYAPAGLEILRPEKEMHFNINQLQSMLMDLSAISIQYSSYILERVLKPDDAETIRRQIDARAEIGRRHIKSAPEQKEK